jgi:hypothetical protein
MSQLWVASMMVLWLLVFVQTFLLAGALRQLGILNLRIGPDSGAWITEAGLDRGAQAPDFEATEAQPGKQQDWPTFHYAVLSSFSCHPTALPAAS